MLACLWGCKWCTKYWSLNFTAVVTDPSDGQREPARAVELRPWAAWWLLATRKRGTERRHRRRQVGAPLAEEQNQPFLTCVAPADRARVRTSESITRANPRVYRVGAAFGRERLICACAPCGGELGDRAKQPKIGYASAE